MDERIQRVERQVLQEVNQIPLHQEAKGQEKKRWLDCHRDDAEQKIEFHDEKKKIHAVAVVVVATKKICHG